ncbi:MAG: ADP-ribosylglycohydrolase family protein [Armatimonadetes bacterium]|nr:ADP-ribosylglycohydrolase family protein [Armatimonadota bacterium]MDE2205061.1 ADP-ribosylglycohydrolase family protein [Armatimonadota bacterium]
MASLEISTADYADKVLGAWQGRLAGLTLGSNLQGSAFPGSLAGWPTTPSQPYAGPWMDFPLVWLATLEQRPGEVTPEDLAAAWMDHLAYNQSELGFAALNMRRGLRPPASGFHSNPAKHGVAGFARAEIWALTAPGAPQIAAARACYDSRMDHAEEGVWSAMFLAALQSSAFFLSDTMSLLTIGLAMIPRTCRTAIAVKAALATWQQGRTWLTAREAVMNSLGGGVGNDAALTAGFFTIGFLAALGGFGEAICAAANCGFESEAAAGAVGSTLGILLGARGLPPAWIAPLAGVIIPGVGLVNFRAAATTQELADRTAALGAQIVSACCHDTAICETVAVPESPDVQQPAAPPSADGARDVADPAHAASGAAEPAAALVAPPSVAPTERAEAPASSPVPDDTDLTEPVPTPQAAVPSDLPAPLPVATAAIPQPINSDAATVPQTEVLEQDEAEQLTAPPQVTAAPAAPDWSGAIAWADSTSIKPLLVAPPCSTSSPAGAFTVTMDMGANAAVAYNENRQLQFTVLNTTDQPFDGRVSLLAPAGWQVAAPPDYGQRHVIAAGAAARFGFAVMVREGSAFIDIANALTLRLDPSDGGSTMFAEFVILGASCWVVTGPFASFGGDGYDRAGAPEDRPGLAERYTSRLQQSIGWERRVFAEASMDLESLFRSSEGVCYGQTVFRSRAARDARLVVNSNYGVKVWLNGALVFRRLNKDPWLPQVGSGPWAVDISLRAGDNVIMVKWVRSAEPIRFVVGLADGSGCGIADIGNTGW